MTEQAPKLPDQIFVVWEHDANAAEGEGWYLTASESTGSLAEMEGVRRAAIYTRKEHIDIVNQTEVVHIGE